MAISALADAFRSKVTCEDHIRVLEGDESLTSIRAFLKNGGEAILDSRNIKDRPTFFCAI